jgi:hypothetical protein
MRETVFKKVVEIINSTQNMNQLPASLRFMELYFKMYGNKNKWVLKKLIERKIKLLES